STTVRSAENCPGSGRGSSHGTGHPARVDRGKRMSTSTDLGRAATPSSTEPPGRQSKLRSIPLIYLALVIVILIGALLLATQGKSLFSAGSIIDILTRSSLL